jgi:methylated-DNA-[protein]-cysteine S-methyltransferase
MSTEPSTIDSLTMTTPIGSVTLEAEANHLIGITIHDDTLARATNSTDNSVLRAASSQLTEYFAGNRTSFNLPLNPRGTVFQRKIWNQLSKVSYGESLTYAELGALSGHPRSARAVGGAVGANPLPILIPCHRVMGADGSLTGYSGGGGLETKKRLLDLERHR